MRLLALTRVLTAAAVTLTALATAGAIAQDTERRVSIEVLSEKRVAEPGSTIWVALRQKIAPGWHTYWSNPGDSGEPTRITWTLPQGLTASPIRWPLPDPIPVGTLMNHGYSDEVLLLSQITVPQQPHGPVTLTADATWLVCKEICIPEEGSASIDLTIGATPQASEHAALLSEAVSRLPTPSPWNANFAATPEALNLTIAQAGLDPARVSKLHFFPNVWGQVAYAAKQDATWTRDGGLVLSLKRGDLKDRPVDKLSGLLVIDEKLDGAIVRHGFEIAAAPGATATAISALAAPTEIGFIQALLFALVGGVILNLMPCVLPVLSLKAFSLARHGSEHAAERRRQGLAYFAGVLACFAVVATVLLGLRATGQALGWGFQFQSPLFVLAMAALFFALGLSMSGVFLIGTSVTNTGSGLGAREGVSGSFFTGVLASIAATPCTAPFMGAAIGFALTQPAIEAAVVILALGVGFALPIVGLSFSSTLARLLPKPGPWMETLKRVLALPLYATTAWLVWILSLQTDRFGLLAAIIVLLAVGVSAWWLGKPSRAGPSSKMAAAAALVAAAIVSYHLVQAPPGAADNAGVAQAGAISEPFTPARLADLRQQRKPVFVNFTAAWCITCKVNEQVALSSEDFKSAVADKGITYLKGDWTRQDADITAMLQRFGRAGVPLYLFYDGSGGEPVVLPQLLTPAGVLEHFASLPITPQAKSKQAKSKGDQS